MGAQQSTSSASAGPNGQAKTCYYELIGVEQTATDDEIKKAYRRQALKHHPDKNPDDIEAATERFAEIQAAYEVLSDPQERSWYDSHRAAILGGVDPSDIGTANDAYSSAHHTSSDKILALISRFNSTVRFTDDPVGFYGSLNSIFTDLADEERASSEQLGVSDNFTYPDFGTSKSDYDTVVRPFYSVWANFSSCKTFAWADKYRLSDAPDRRVRRLMEKDNQKARQDALREFNETVRFLVSFARKRDPRYQRNVQTEAERQQSLREASAAQAARSRAANQRNMDDYVVPEWAQSQPAEQDSIFTGDEEEEIVEEIECVVCDKTFKSEKQFEAHERSKKHLKIVQQLRRDLKREERLFEKATAAQKASDPAPNPEPESIPPPALDSDVDGNISEADEAPVVETEDCEPAPGLSAEQPDNLKSAPSDGSESGSPPDISPLAIADDDDANEELETKKIGKAKAKRLKKAARDNTENQQNQTSCKVCNEEFDSRTKLFAHIKKAGHATATPVTTKPKGKKKK
ncbi:hypothetical protein BROUX41_006271 [Berkeleyomyces rouxiae]|uniref:uncharacterized protein n=1 Tax=Berkeleyomyces rouxiae TaxID=2035830 RepID=UPI003B801697